MRAVGEALADLVMGWVAAWLVGIAWWWVLRAGWRIYTHTFIGMRFTETHPAFAEAADIVLGSLDVLTCAKLASVFIAAALILGIGAQLVLLRNLVYLRTPKLLRWVWGVVLAVALAPSIAAEMEWPSDAAAFLMVVPIAIVALSTGMTLAGYFPSLPALVLNAWDAMRDRLGR
ncbi:MAG: hypothetical protein D6771_01530 [Zetaproteobacteria bacterium]|nr:MAG: hypothetical protein D6771_01530 [Zetaproteobacteria bacterium]